jgi:leucyl-tRNA synthetase
LDKANCEAVQKNLTTDFLRLAVSHRAEISKLLDFQETLVGRMRKEMETVAEPIKPAEPVAVGLEFEDDDEDPVEEQEPSILHVLNEDKPFVYIFRIFILFFSLWVQRVEHCPTSVP